MLRLNVDKKSKNRSVNVAQEVYVATFEDRTEGMYCSPFIAIVIRAVYLGIGTARKSEYLFVLGNLALLITQNEFFPRLFKSRLP